MAQPAGWLWGLVPLAVLWGAGTLVLGEAVRRDVAQRAERVATAAAGGAPGARAVVAEVVGRDVSLSGESLSADGATRAMTRLRQEFGVRRALGGLSQVAVQKPYGWSAAFQGKVLVLSGYVPDEATADANVAAAEAALPGVRIEDRQSLAFGAPPNFDGMTRLLLAEIAALSSGKVALDDERFCIEGTAKSPDHFLALRSGAAARPQGAFQPVECSLDPPVIKPYRWSAERLDDAAVAVDGYHPTEEVRQELAALLRRTFPEPIRIEDRTKPASGAPGSFVAKASRAIADLGRLRTGKVQIDDDAYILTGAGPLDSASCQALRLQIAQGDGPDSVAQVAIDCPLPPVSLPSGPAAGVASASAGQGAASTAAAASPDLSPVPEIAWRWRAVKSQAGILVEGLVASEDEKVALLAAARAATPSGLVEDRLAVERHLRAASDHRAATRFLLGQLARMSTGTVAIEDRTATLSGAASSEEDWVVLEAALRQRPLPGGLSGELRASTVVLRPYALTIAVDRSGVLFSGYWPDPELRASVMALLREPAAQGKVADTARIVPGAPAGFGEAARVAIADLLRLDMGTARLSDTGIELQGLTCRELIKSEVETSLASAMPPHLEARAEIGLRQTGCLIDPPNVCQNDLDSLTQRYSVLFGQGTAAVALDPVTERAIADAYAILKQCPSARITIEGHANRDGERHGFGNLDLSRRRAQRVREELMKRGIAGAQLDIKGYGALRPLVPHDDADAKVRNRRVQFTVMK